MFSEVNSSPCPHAPRDDICTAWAPLISERQGKSPVTKCHQIPSVATTYQALPSMIQLPLALRLTGFRAQFFAEPARLAGRHLHSMGPVDFGGTRRNSGNQVSPNAVRCHDVPGSSVDEPAAFGPKADRPPRSILCRARMLHATAFARHCPLGLRQDMGNRRPQSFTNCPPLS